MKRKLSLKNNFYFPSPEFCTPSHNNVKRNFLWKNTPENFFSKICFFIIFLMFPQRWIIQNQLNLSEENKFQWIFFSPEYIFTFLSSVLCTPADNNVVRKKFMKNGFQKKYLFWKNCFFQNSCVTPLVSFTEPFQKNFLNVIFYDEKIYSEECFFLSNFGTSFSHWKQCYPKHFLEKKIFSQEKY